MGNEKVFFFEIQLSSKLNSYLILAHFFGLSYLNFINKL